MNSEGSQSMEVDDDESVQKSSVQEQREVNESQRNDVSNDDLQARPSEANVNIQSEANVNINNGSDVPFNVDTNLANCDRVESLMSINSIEPSSLSTESNLDSIEPGLNESNTCQSGSQKSDCVVEVKEAISGVASEDVASANAIDSESAAVSDAPQNSPVTDTVRTVSSSDALVHSGEVCHFKKDADSSPGREDEEVRVAEEEEVYRGKESDGEFVVLDVSQKGVDSPVTEKTDASTQDNCSVSHQSGTDDLDHPAHHAVDQPRNDPTVETTEYMLGHSFQEVMEDGHCVRKLLDREGNSFVFHCSEDHKVNQMRYQTLCEDVTDEIYRLLETECLLRREYIPEGAKENEPRSFIFVSKGAFSTEDRLLLIIHGSGGVRAGQWSRRIIINDYLEAGSQLPYIKMARERGYEVIVLNTNLNVYPDNTCTRYVNEKKRRDFIQNSEDPESHARYVWTNYIQSRVKAKHIGVVAHSYGGVVTVDLACTFTADFLRRVFAVALTDSVHSLDMVPRNKQSDLVRRFYSQHAKNWVSSHKSLDEKVEGSPNDAPLVSAGTRVHEWTSDSCKDSLFLFLEEQFQERINPSQTRRKEEESPSQDKSGDCTAL